MTVKADIDDPSFPGLVEALNVMRAWRELPCYTIGDNKCFDCGNRSVLLVKPDIRFDCNKCGSKKTLCNKVILNEKYDDPRPNWI